MKNGSYELVVAPDEYPGKLYRGRYAYEHRVVWWQNTGEMPSGEIHHINGDKRDNRFENLKLLPTEEHNRLHNKEKGVTYVKLECPACGKIFERKKRASHLVKPIKASYCSRECVGGMASDIYDQHDQVIDEYKKYKEIPR